MKADLRPVFRRLRTGRVADSAVSATAARDRNRDIGAIVSVNATGWALNLYSTTDGSHLRSQTARSATPVMERDRRINIHALLDAEFGPRAN